MLQSVLALQPNWSKDLNSDSMLERGVFVQGLIPEFISSKFKDGLWEAEGSNGLGLAAKIPWTRIFLPEKSPKPTTGFYLVYLFALDGSAVYLSLNQGTQINTGQGFTSIGESEIIDRRQWARTRLGGLVDGLDLNINLGDTESKGKARDYERGHVAGWTYPIDEIPTDEILLENLHEALNCLLAIYDSVEGAKPEEEKKTLNIQQLAADTLWSEEELVDVIDTLKSRRPQIVLAGPPGTGKTWVAERIAGYLTGGIEGAVRTVQFHPSYSFEDFVVGLRPIPGESGAIQFSPVDGVLVEMAELARDVEHPVVLIIDEMNRANLPSVFGELMHLLDYRDKEISILHKGDFSLPRNLIIIGTMNTADRSIRVSIPHCGVALTFLTVRHEAKFSTSSMNAPKTFVRLSGFPTGSILLTSN